MMAPGGVCAVLDYEIDQMTEYIAEMAQRIALPGAPVSPAFRKFVSGLLSSTRLPSTTILLGMNLLARRSNSLKHAGAGKFSDGTVWRMLTIGLLLGSKFLDDNTFQNRSWSEVSGIAVSELNTLEIEWLESMNWNLYLNLDTSEDYTAWLANWNDWRSKKNVERKATLDRLAPLAPIDTNVQRPRPYTQAYATPSKSNPIERPPPGFHATYAQNTWHPYSTPPHLTPPSAPDSAIHTPEYLSATGGAPGHQWTDWSVYNQQQYSAYQPQMQPTYVPTRIAVQHTPFTPYGQHHYDETYDAYYNRKFSDGRDCSCGNCGQYKVKANSYVPPWSQAHPYGYVGQQLVA